MPENYPGIITQNVILSAAFDPTGNVNPSTDAPGARFTTATNGSQISAYSHWQDTVPDGIRGTTSGSAGPNKPGANQGYITTSPTIANEFELDVETLNHTFQTMSTVAPMPGISKETLTTHAINTAQIISLNIDLGMMRELISIQGILWDMENHPSSTTGHHIRRQHLLDIARTQWANVHNNNRVTGFEGNDPNRLLGLTIGPKHGMGSTAQLSEGDRNYYGDEPANDIRGSQIQGSGGYQYAGRTSTASSYEWDYKLTYTGRRRYRGLIRRLTLTALGGQPNIWRYTFDFEVIKNELEQRVLEDNREDPAVIGDN